MFDKILQSLAPIAALAMGAGLSGCDNMNVTINGEEGVPLSELDMAGAAPTELVLATNVTVIITEGETLDISVEGDSEGALRFVLDQDSIGVMSDPDLEIRDGKATVRVTMPAPQSITIAGSGSVETGSVAETAELTIGGSGSILAKNIAAQSLEIRIGGSGSIKGSGTAERLEISIGGSGDVAMPSLNANIAEVSIGGAGDVEFSSDGEVEATIAGAGDVRVTGSAKCTVSAMGSGTLTCGPGPAAAADEAQPVTDLDAQ
ncbi:GIN domain-containing protein [Qipengyuania sp. ASV99]|uniref:GIN domain-containing protein n=1 Tax=Qipengyuania sp. ASV99 TaxID=3399681 RepID=UPI003A4C7C72